MVQPKHKKSGKECVRKWMKVEPLRNSSRTTEFSSRRHFTTSNECVCRFWTFVVVLGTVFGHSNIPARKQTVVISFHEFRDSNCLLDRTIFWSIFRFISLSIFSRVNFSRPEFCARFFFIVGGCGKHTTTSLPTDTINRTFFNWHVRVWLWVATVILYLCCCCSNCFKPNENFTKSTEFFMHFNRTAAVLYMLLQHDVPVFLFTASKLCLELKRRRLYL